MSLNKYKRIDLSIFAVIVAALEALNLIAFSKFGGEMFTLSVTLAVTLIVMMRWGAWGLIHAALGGAVYCLVSGWLGSTVGYELYAIYVGGNLFLALDLALLLIVGKEKLRGSLVFTVLYVVCGYLFMCIGRTIIALFFGNPFFDQLVRYLAVDALGALITIVIIMVARRQDGVFEDQLTYLKRTASERENGKS